MVSTGLVFVGALFAAVAVGVGYLAYRSGEEAPEEVDWEEQLGFHEEATDLEAERHGEETGTEGGEGTEETHPGFNEDAPGLEANRPPDDERED
ncbi:hypothetical protein [Halospeciosus flavus]|uniref:Secreted protein n=1 Tax=Halospeciosus flavus TaxID=3032283 RepID=A0ABD5Z8C5_9EURY|nr:hypothetical protein [Halospeciosus flavus]